MQKTRQFSPFSKHNKLPGTKAFSAHTGSVTKTLAWRSDCMVNFALASCLLASLCKHAVGFSDRAHHFYSIATIYACIKPV